MSTLLRQRYRIKLKGCGNAIEYLRVTRECEEYISPHGKHTKRPKKNPNLVIHIFSKKETYFAFNLLLNWANTQLLKVIVSIFIPK